MRNNEIVRLLHILKNVKGGHVKGGCKRWPHPLESNLQGRWANPNDGNRRKAVRITPTRSDYPNRSDYPKRT